MNTQPPKSRCRRQSQRLRQSNPLLLPPPILPIDIIIEILSWLTVKHLMQMKCVSKSWKTLISDPTFIKKHLSRSRKNPHMSVVSSHTFIDFPLSHLLENRSITLPKDPYYRLNTNHRGQVLGSCNGLICLMDYSPYKSILGTIHLKVSFRLWNPATRTISNILGYSFFCNERFRFLHFFTFVFGYDNSTNTYKVVSLHLSGKFVRVFSFSDNVWRTIQSFPIDTRPRLSKSDICAGIYLSCTVNWLACRTDLVDDSGIQKLVIISLDLSTERYTQMLPPQGFDQKVVHEGKNLCVLKDSLCFYHDLMRTDFLIWQMTEFGDEKSWTQFLKFSYHSVNMNHKIGGEAFLFLTPLHLSHNGDTLVLATNQEPRAIIYNRRTKRSRKTKINKKIDWFLINDYVESLVATC